MADVPDVARVLQTAIEGANLRQKVIANNIANVETPGYRRRESLFEMIMADAIEDGNAADLHENEAWVFTPRTTPVGEGGNDVQLDSEVGDLVHNSLMYKTYVRLLGRTYRQMDMAIRDELR
jgi:flagellar basal-body rod protein FlgB